MNPVSDISRNEFVRNDSRKNPVIHIPNQLQFYFSKNICWETMLQQNMVKYG